MLRGFEPHPRCKALVSKRSKEVITKWKKKKIGCFPERSKGLGSSSSAFASWVRIPQQPQIKTRILTATVYNSRAVKGVRLKLSAL